MKKQLRTLLTALGMQEEVEFEINLGKVEDEGVKILLQAPSAKRASFRGQLSITFCTEDGTMCSVSVPEKDVKVRKLPRLK